MPFNKQALRPAKPLDEIFAIPKPVLLAHELNAHCLQKLYGVEQPLTEAERIYFALSRIGSVIVGDGFISLFVQFFTPDSFREICDALTEVGASKLRDLLREAWSIYTKDRAPITLDELQSIS
jgi:hypothetical protein